MQYKTTLSVQEVLMTEADVECFKGTDVFNHWWYITRTKSLIFHLIFHPQIGWRHHYDADITDNDWKQGWLDRFRWLIESSRFEDSSSESDQSLESCESGESSESQSSEESSEEVLIADQTTPVMTTTHMTTITTADGSTLTPEPDTMSTDEPNVTVTPPPAMMTTPSPADVTHCITEEIPTTIPITENRGDN